jgi:phosphopentomutase
VCDGLGVGAAPDAELYGDAGSDTFGHVIDAAGIELPNLERLGLLRAAGRSGARPVGAWGKMRPVSAGKDSTSGHWEMMGLATARPFPVYPGGFPEEVLDPIEREAGVRFLGNRPASGTEILDELGPEHRATGRPILYTSADSVFQVAAHEDVLPPERLWEICGIARRHLAGRHAVGRVIARPFTGRPGAYARTERRRDFSLAPPGETLLDRAVAAGRRTWGIGKISDLFAGRGISGSSYSSSDADGIARTLGRLREADDDLIFTNLVDFDSKYGHRNDAAGFAENLARLDRAIPGLRDALADGDLLLVTGDHGCDPCDASTDHTREWVPILAVGKRVREDAELGARPTFADLGATVGEWLGLPAAGTGTSFLPALLA